MNFYFLFIFAAILGLYLIDSYSEYLNLKSLAPILPSGFEDIYDASRYAQSQEYTRVKTRASMVEAAVTLVVFLAFWLLGGFGWLDQHVRAWAQSTIVRGLIYVGILQLASMVISLPFELYYTFVIEQRFGFNKTTPGVFISDRLKSLMLLVLLGGPLLAVILFLFDSWGTWAWLYGWLITAAFTLIMAYLGPALILPLFYKLKPLPDGELKSAIEHMAQQCAFPLEEVCEVDGSRRSTKANAFFTGLGRHKKIALYDTLIQRHSVGELVAILAHEIGHFKKRHVLQNLAISILQMGFLFALIGFFMKNPGLHDAFHVTEPSVYTSLVLFMVLYQPISKLLSVGMMLLSRKNEYEADAFAASVTGQPLQLVSGLKKLSGDSLTNLTPHPLHVFLNYSHPPVVQRVAALEQQHVQAS